VIVVLLLDGSSSWQEGCEVSKSKCGPVRLWAYVLDDSVAGVQEEIPQESDFTAVPNVLGFLDEYGSFN
jgi:hypothetical protein